MSSAARADFHSTGQRCVLFFKESIHIHLYDAWLLFIIEVMTRLTQAHRTDH